MRAEKEVTFYNVLFPIWFLILFPVAWIVVLPANFIIDSIVLLISIKLLKMTDILKTYRYSILKVWVVGFLSDFVGAGILFIFSMDNTAGWSEFLDAVSWNPFDNMYAVLLVAFAVIVSGIFIYFCNVKFAFNNVEESRKKRRIALALAVFTAPYILFYPSSLMHGNSWDDLKFMTNHIVKRDEIHMEVLLNKVPSNPSDEERIIMNYYEREMKDAVNVAEKTSESVAADQKQPEFTLLFYNREYTGRKEISVWMIDEKHCFMYGNDWYELNGDKIDSFLEAVSDLRNSYGKREFVLRPDPLTSGVNKSSYEMKEDKDGKKESEYPVYEDSENRYYSLNGFAQFESTAILFEGSEPVDIYTALDKGMVTPQQLIQRGMDLKIEKRE